LELSEGCLPEECAIDYVEESHFKTLNSEKRRYTDEKVVNIEQTQKKL
jgi:hypothetical protein